VSDYGRQDNRILRRETKSTFDFASLSNNISVQGNEVRYFQNISHRYLQSCALLLRASHEKSRDSLKRICLMRQGLAPRQLTKLNAKVFGCPTSGLRSCNERLE
jgi:hypothetical protein